MSAPIYTEPNETPQESYLEYSEKVTTAVMDLVDQGKLSPAQLYKIGEFLTEYPLVQIPRMQYENETGVEDFYNAYYITLGTQQTLYGSAFEADNSKAGDEVRGWINLVRSEIAEYIDQTNKKLRDLTSEELLYIISIWKHSQNQKKLAEQILSGNPISNEEDVWEKNLIETVLPNVLQSIRIINKLEDYEMPNIF